MPRTIEYKDPEEGFAGYLVYDREDCRIAVGGCRVQAGVTQPVLGRLAALMTVKQRVLGINADGAKCGIDYDPRSPGMEAALGRFLGFLRDELSGRLSLGCDMGTQWQQMERLGRAIGVPSVKFSVKTAQSLSEQEFFARLRLLEAPVGPLTLGQRRAGHALAYAVRSAVERTGADIGTTTVALQGFGNLGRGAVCAFAEWGTAVVAVADEHGCARDGAGLDLERLLADPAGTPVRHFGTGQLDRDAVFSTECDVLVLAAAEDAMTVGQAAEIPCRIVVVGSNAGLSEAAEDVLTRRGVLVIPDFLGGVGGSASMAVLFGWPRTLEPRGVLDTMETLLSGVFDEVLTVSARTSRTPRQAGLAVAAAAAVDAEAAPYADIPHLREAMRAHGGGRRAPQGAGR